MIIIAVILSIMIGMLITLGLYIYFEGPKTLSNKIDDIQEEAKAFFRLGMVITLGIWLLLQSIIAILK